MADALSSRPDFGDSDGPPRPPTFVQIRPPAVPGRARWKVGVPGIGVALVMAVGWGIYRTTEDRDAPVVAQAEAVSTDVATPQHVFVELYDELARRAIDSAISTPAWTQESPMDRVTPFDPSVSDRMPSSSPPTETANTTQAGVSEISVRLGKGDTIGSALQRLGLASGAIRQCRLCPGAPRQAQASADRFGHDGADPARG